MRLLMVALCVLLLTLPAAAKGKPTDLNLAVPAYDSQSTTWIEQQDDWPQPADFIRNSAASFTTTKPSTTRTEIPVTTDLRTWSSGSDGTDAVQPNPTAQPAPAFTDAP